MGEGMSGRKGVTPRHYHGQHHCNNHSISAILEEFSRVIIMPPNVQHSAQILAQYYYREKVSRKYWSKYVKVLLQRSLGVLASVMGGVEAMADGRTVVSPLSNCKLPVENDWRGDLWKVSKRRSLSHNQIRQAPNLRCLRRRGSWHPYTMVEGHVLFVNHQARITNYM